jgi:futalosine hydrolase
MLLIVTAAQAEAAALVAGLEPLHRCVPSRLGPYSAHRNPHVTVVAGGIGPAAAAAVTATALCTAPAQAVLSVGIGGGFGLAVGTLVVADLIVAADLGAHSPGGWLGGDELGWAEQTPVAVPGAAALARRLTEGLAGCGPTRCPPVRCGPVLTLSAMTGTAARAAELAARHGALAEAMEGAGVALAAGRHGVPVGEVRAVSNPVGDRDRDSWDLPAALGALERAAPILLEAWS